MFQYFFVSNTNSLLPRHKVFLSSWHLFSWSTTSLLSYYGTQKFIRLFKKAWHRNLYGVCWIQTTPSHSIWHFPKFCIHFSILLYMLHVSPTYLS